MNGIFGARKYLVRLAKRIGAKYVSYHRTVYSTLLHKTSI